MPVLNVNNTQLVSMFASI